MATSKLLFMLGVCILAIFLLSPVKAINSGHASRNPQEMILVRTIEDGTSFGKQQETTVQSPGKIIESAI